MFDFSVLSINIIPSLTKKFKPKTLVLQQVTKYYRIYIDNTYNIENIEYIDNTDTGNRFKIPYRNTEMEKEYHQLYSRLQITFHVSFFFHTIE